MGGCLIQASAGEPSVAEVNPWEGFADRFEEMNTRVVGVETIQEIQRHLASRWRSQTATRCPTQTTASTPS